MELIINKMAILNNLYEVNKPNIIVCEDNKNIIPNFKLERKVLSIKNATQELQNTNIITVHKLSEYRRKKSEFLLIPEIHVVIDNFLKPCEEENIYL